MSNLRAVVPGTEQAQGDQTGQSLPSSACLSSDLWATPEAVKESWEVRGQGPPLPSRASVPRSCKSLDSTASRSGDPCTPDTCEPT